MDNYNYEDLLIALNDVGLKRGDTVFIHSNLGYYGKMQNVKTASDLCNEYVRAFNEILGNEGTIIVPSFTYSFCHNEVFNVQESVSSCGMLSEYIRKLNINQRSRDANFSVCGFGKKINDLIKDIPNESFGLNSIWDRMMDVDGKILCMNFDSGSTFVHYVEQQKNVTYRYKKAFNGMMVDDGEIRRDYFVHFVYDLEKLEDAPDFRKLDLACKQEGVSKTVNLGKGNMKLMNCREYYNLIADNLKSDPRFLTIKN